MHPTDDRDRNPYRPPAARDTRLPTAAERREARNALGEAVLAVALTAAVAAILCPLMGNFLLDHSTDPTAAAVLAWLRRPLSPLARWTLHAGLAALIAVPGVVIACRLARPRGEDEADIDAEPEPEA